MRVLLLDSITPFRTTAADHLRRDLLRALLASGVDAEAFTIPTTQAPPERLVDEMVIARRLCLSHIDRLIVFRFPTYLAPAPQKVVWLPAGGRAGSGLTATSGPTDKAASIAQSVRTAERAAFAEAREVFVESHRANANLAALGLRAKVMRRPLGSSELFSGGGFDDYVLVNGLVDAGRSQRALVRALRHALTIRVVVVGAAPRAEGVLKRLAEAEGVGDRVVFAPAPDSTVAAAALVNRALAVACLSDDPDSGNIRALEAIHAAKPVIATTEADAVLDVVRDGETGIVVSPDVAAIASVLSSLTATSARRLGRSAKAVLRTEMLSWPQTVDRLLC